jgi:ascorbate-specific PTS system EIIC-type component UlaA
MDYTPISTRRVLLAFAFTAFVALVPVLYFLLQSGHGGPLSIFADADGGYRGLVLGAGSVALTTSLIGAPMLMVAVGRRMVRRPSRA